MVGSLFSYLTSEVKKNTDRVVSAVAHQAKPASEPVKEKKKLPFDETLDTKGMDNQVMSHLIKENRQLK